MPWRPGSRRKRAWRGTSRTCGAVPPPRAPWPWRSSATETLLEDGAEALRAVQTQVVTPALERLVEANTLLSGLGFESSGLAAAHAVHNGLTAAPGTHAYFHGEKVAYGLLVQLVLEGQPRPVLEQVLRFRHRSRAAHHAGRDRPDGTAEGIAPAGSQPGDGARAKRSTTSRSRSGPTWWRTPSWRPTPWGGPGRSTRG